MQILSFRFNFVYIVFGLFMGQKTFGQSDFCDMGSRFQESVRIVQKHWWYDSNIKPTNDFFKALAEKSAGSVGSLVAGQTAHQVGDIFEGVFYLVTLRPGKALDHISNGVNPLGLVNSVISDVGSCVESPFVERGFPRESLKVGIQNISQMINDDKFHWSLPATAPLNPARHVGVYTPMSRMVMNWGGELNLDNPLYSEAVYDSRYQSEFMAMERLYCSVHNLKNKLNMDTDYYLLGYNCGGFVSDALEIAGMNSPYFANCGIGSELRALGPSVELKKSIQESCDSVIDSIPALLTRLELGDEIPLTQWQNYKNLNPSPSLYIHLMSAALRGRNLKNLAWAKALPTPIGIYEMTGAKSDLSVVIEHLKKSLESREKKVEIADSVPSWQPSDFVNESFPDFVWGLQLEDMPLVSHLNASMYKILDYFCSHWLHSESAGFEFCDGFHKAPTQYQELTVNKINSIWLGHVLDSYFSAQTQIEPGKRVSLKEVKRFLDNLSFVKRNFMKVSEEKIKELWRILSFDRAIEMLGSGDRPNQIVINALKVGIGTSSFETTAVFATRHSEIARLIKKIDSANYDSRIWATVLWISPFFKSYLFSSMHKHDRTFKFKLLKFYSEFGIKGVVDVSRHLFGNEAPKNESMLGWILHEFDRNTEASMHSVFIDLFRDLGQLDENYEGFKEQVSEKIQNKIEDLTSRKEYKLSRQYGLILESL